MSYFLGRDKQQPDVQNHNSQSKSTINENINWINFGINFGRSSSVMLRSLGGLGPGIQPIKTTTRFEINLYEPM